MRLAALGLAELTRDGLFDPGEEVMWDFEIHIHSLEEWTQFVERPNCGGVDVDEKAIAAALAHTNGSIVLTEENQAHVYRKRSTA